MAAGDGGSFELGTDGPKVGLVGVDESITSARAAWYAAGLARRAGARLITVYVAPIASMAATAPGGAAIVTAEAEAHDLSAEQLCGQAENAARERGIPLTFIEAYGDPYAEIRRIADERHADALVSGRRRSSATGWWDRWRCGWCGRAGGRSPSSPNPAARVH